MIIHRVITMWVSDFISLLTQLLTRDAMAERSIWSTSYSTSVDKANHIPYTDLSSFYVQNTEIQWLTKIYASGVHPINIICHATHASKQNAYKCFVDVASWQKLLCMFCSLQQLSPFMFILQNTNNKYQGVNLYRKTVINFL